MDKPLKLEPVIGLEIHVQLKTASKMFCSCSNKGEDAAPNTTICPICLAHPGTLPVPNRQAIILGLKAALALGATIPQQSRFDRKHYFYPDLPKGYQISQYDHPVALGGGIRIDGTFIRLVRLHLEEDAAKLLHDTDGTSLVDFNRAGTPLAETVTEPDIRTPEQAKAFLQEFRLIMRYVGASDADMEKGHMRCDANISLRPIGEDKRYPKTEVKNINSFRSVERALRYEIERQTALWEQGQIPMESTTRGWDDAKGITVLQRSKEEANDYRYFPEPDIPPLEFSPEFVESIRADIHELPSAKRERFIAEYGFTSADARIVVEDKALADFTEAVIAELMGWLETKDPDAGTEGEAWEKNKSKLTKLVANWLVNRYLNILNARSKTVAELPITPENFAQLLTLISAGQVNSTNAQLILEKMADTGKDPAVLLDEMDLKQMASEGGDMEKFLDEAINANPTVVADYRKGKAVALMFLVGQVMKLSKGKANPSVVQDELKKRLSSPNDSSA